MTNFDPEGELDLFADSARAQMARNQMHLESRQKKHRSACAFVLAAIALAIPGIWITDPINLKLWLGGSCLLCIVVATALYLSRRTMLRS